MKNKYLIVQKPIQLLKTFHKYYYCFTSMMYGQREYIHFTNMFMILTNYCFIFLRGL